MTLTDREKLIAKISTLTAASVVGSITIQEAFDSIKKNAKKHGYSLDEAIKLQDEIDDMLKDSTGE